MGVLLSKTPSGLVGRGAMPTEERSVKICLIRQIRIPLVLLVAATNVPPMRHALSEFGDKPTFSKRIARAKVRQGEKAQVPECAKCQNAQVPYCAKSQSARNPRLREMPKRAIGALRRLGPGAVWDLAPFGTSRRLGLCVPGEFMGRLGSPAEQRFHRHASRTGRATPSSAPIDPAPSRASPAGDSRTGT